MERTGTIKVSIIFCTRYRKAEGPSISNSYLAGVAGFPQFPATITTTATYERWVATQHDVEDNSEAPQVTALVVNCSLLTESLNYLRCHVLC